MFVSVFFSFQYKCTYILSISIYFDGIIAIFNSTTEAKEIPSIERIISASPIFGYEMGDAVRFNNKLSFMKSVTFLILPFFLEIANDGA
jgi:hypothetical protein